MEMWKPSIDGWLQGVPDVQALVHGCDQPCGTPTLRLPVALPSPPTSRPSCLGRWRQPRRVALPHQHRRPAPLWVGGGAVRMIALVGDVMGGQRTDDELTVDLALAADPELAVADDAVYCGSGPASDRITGFLSGIHAIPDGSAVALRLEQTAILLVIISVFCRRRLRLATTAAVPGACQPGTEPPQLELPAPGAAAAVADVDRSAKAGTRASMRPSPRRVNRLFGGRGRTSRVLDRPAVSLMAPAGCSART